VNDLRKANKTDAIVISIICLIALVCYYLINYFITDSSDLYAEINFNGKLVSTIDLTELSLSDEYVFSIPEVQSVLFKAKDRSIAFFESDCVDKICVESGFLGKNGQAAACLPNKLSLIIKSKAVYSDNIDIVVP